MTILLIISVGVILSVDTYLDAPISRCVSRCKYGFFGLTLNSDKYEKNCENSEYESWAMYLNMHSSRVSKIYLTYTCFSISLIIFILISLF
jgi:hypothetical protein